MFSLLGTLLVGLVAGLIARAIKPGDDSMGWFMTMLLGVCGALLATYVGVGLGWYREGTAAGWIAAVVGSVVLLFLDGMVRRKG